MKCRDCEHWGWGDDEGTPVWGWCWIRTSCPDPDIERTCPAFSPKAPNISTTLSTLQAENEKLRAEVESFKKGHCAGCSIPAVKAEQIRDLTDAPKLRAELEQVKHALAMMWFASVNSDKETPHSYETEAIEEAERLLGPWEECMPKYLRRGQKED